MYCIATNIATNVVMIIIFLISFRVWARVLEVLVAKGVVLDHKNANNCNGREHVRVCVTHQSHYDVFSVLNLCVMLVNVCVCVFVCMCVCVCV